MDRFSRYAIFDLVSRNKRIVLLGKEEKQKLHLLNLVKQEFSNASYRVKPHKKGHFALLDESAMIVQSQFKEKLLAHIEQDGGFILVPNIELIDTSKFISDDMIDYIVHCHYEEHTESHYYTILKN